MADIKVVNFKKSDREGAIKAFCGIEIAGKITIYGCKLLEGSNGLWVSMPQRQDQNNKYWDIVKISNDALKGEITKAIIAAYEGQSGGSDTSSSSDPEF